MGPLQAGLESNAWSRDWVDGKRYRWLLSPVSPVVGLGPLSVLGAMAARPGVLRWLVLFAFYSIAPLIDVLIGTDRINAPLKGFSYSPFQGTARMSVLRASTMSNAELTTRRLRS